MWIAPGDAPALTKFLHKGSRPYFGINTGAEFGPANRWFPDRLTEVECSPCFLRECPIDFRCMKSIIVKHVTDAALQLGNETERTHGRAVPARHISDEL